MKQSILLMTMLFTLIACLAAVDTADYDLLKKSQPYIPQQAIATTPSTGEFFSIQDDSKDPPALLIPLDGTFTLAMSANDDGSTGQITLPWTFTLYGTPYTFFWINNNGNITFDGPYGSFSSTGFPLDGIPMLAPFWADVDTRGSGSGLVYYRIETNPNRVVVIWDGVGYFSSQTDKLNTFSAIFTDGTDPLIGIGNNVVFSYAEMQWTTGSASGGSGGFGGIPATVGINKGSENIYTQAGRFGQAGADYYGDQVGIVFDGGAVPSGVDWLDDRDLYLAASGGTILIILPADPVVVTEGPGMPPGVTIDDPTYETYTATYNAAGNQTVNIPVGAGTWRGWIYYSGSWHQADVFPFVGPGNVVFSNVPFTGGKETLPIIIDLEDDQTLPVELSSFSAIPMVSNMGVQLSWTTQSETGMSGYYIYRNQSNDLGSALNLNAFIHATNSSSTQTYSYADNQLDGLGTYYYWLQAQDIDGSHQFFGPVSVLVSESTPPPPPIPLETRFQSVYPNPFNPATTISYSLKESGNAVIEIFNQRGQIVHRTERQHSTGGNFSYHWNADALTSGIYLVRFNFGKYQDIKKLVLMK